LWWRQGANFEIILACQKIVFCSKIVFQKYKSWSWKFTILEEFRGKIEILSTLICSVGNLQLLVLNLLTRDTLEVEDFGMSWQGLNFRTLWRYRNCIIIKNLNPVGFIGL